MRIFVIGTLFLLCISWYQELWRFPFNHDSGVILDTSRRLLEGEKLYKDIPEVNPPLIFFIGSAIVTLAQITGFHEILVWRLCYLLAITLVVLFAGRLMQKIGWNFEQRRCQGFFWSLIALFLCFPGRDFSQREHLAAVFFLPYVLICSARADEKVVGKKSALISGFIAGLAFSLKPFFLLIFCLVEIYMWGALRKNGQSWIRLENSIFMAISGSFLLWLTLGTPYLQFLRFIQPHYAAYNSHISDLFVNFDLLPFLLVSFLHGVFEPPEDEGHLRQLFFLTALGFTVSYLVQMKGFSYHSLPAKIYSWLLFSLIVLDWASLKAHSEKIIRSIASQVSINFLIFIVVFIILSGAQVHYYVNEELDDFIQQMRELGEGRRVHLLTFSVGPAFPTLTYCSLKTTQRGFTPVLANIYRGKDNFNGPFPYENGTATLRLLQSYRDITVEDIATRKPDYIISDDRLLRQAIGLSRFNFIEFLMLDDRFRELFKRYRFLKEVYGFKIFKRQPE